MQATQLNKLWHNYKPVLWQSCLQLAPQRQWQKPVFFIVEVISVLTSVCLFFPSAYAPYSFKTALAITASLWLTILFSNLSESLAELQGRAKTQSLKASQQNLKARKITSSDAMPYQWIPAAELRKGDCIRVDSGELIPQEGVIRQGSALIDESALTGESTPVIRESGGDRDAVIAGSLVMSDSLIIEVTAQAGESTMDKMIHLIEGAQRKKSQSEQALDTFLNIFTLALWVATMSFWMLSASLAQAHHLVNPINLFSISALFVCLMPTTIAGLLPAIGIAGIQRIFKKNVIALSGHAIDLAGTADVLIVDKTGTVTTGQRQAVALYPAPGVSRAQLGRALYLCSVQDETVEGRSILQLIERAFPLHDWQQALGSHAIYEPFSAHTRLSRMTIGEEIFQKGALDAMISQLKPNGTHMPAVLIREAHELSHAGSTPLVVAESGRSLGIVELQDTLKTGLAQKFANLKSMGLKIVMMTGDNPLTAQKIASLAHIDEVVAEADPIMKVAQVRAFQAQGLTVAMTGDGTNDAPALAQADAALAMNSGTQVAKEAANLIDLDNDPGKIIDIIVLGKQLLITRGALTTFSIANDIAKYFAILPSLCTPFFPRLEILNIMRLNNQTALISATFFNAVIVLLLVPMALKGVRISSHDSNRLLATHLLIYGLGGLLVPFLGIRFIDSLLDFY